MLAMVLFCGGCAYVGRGGGGYLLSVLPVGACVDVDG
jgi:hypothetical protein